jgi:hypothetical protein
MKPLSIAAASLLLSCGAAHAQTTTGSIPKPQLRFIGTENYTTAAGAFTRYKLVVDNEYEFEDALFAASPDLPPCGLNKEAARSWIDIYAGEKRLYGFCAIEGAPGLRKLWFAVRQGEPAPAQVHIVLWDRKTDHKAVSNAVATVKGPTAKSKNPAERR